MKKWIAIAAALLFAAAGFAFAAQRGWGPGWMSGSRGPGIRSMGQRMLVLLDNEQFQSEVNLTDSQVKRLRSIITTAEKSNIQTRAQMQSDGIDLRQLMQSDNPDHDAVMKKVQQISELRGEMMKNNVQALLEAKKILSPEQQKRIRQFIEKRFSERGWGRGGMERHRGRMRSRPGTPPPPAISPGQAQSPSQ